MARLLFSGNGLLGIGGSDQEGIALGFRANLDQASVVDQWEPIQVKNIHICIINIQYI